MTLSKEETKRQRDNILNEFASQVTTCYVHIANNAFLAVGELKKPRNHIIKDVNNVLMWIVGVNRDGTKIIVHSSVEMSMTEAKILPTVFNEFFKKIEKKEKRVLNNNMI